MGRLTTHYTYHSRWTSIFIISITIGVCRHTAKMSSSLPTPVDCEFSILATTELYCTSLLHLGDMTPEAAANVETLTVTYCAADFHRLPALSMLTRMERLAVECDNTANLTVDVGAFRNISSINQIEITHSGIESIPDLEFCQLDKLSALYLQGNRIKQLSQVGLGGVSTSSSCKSTKTLRYLDLSNNDIRKVPNESFLHSLSNLLRLVLDGNKISKIEAEAFKNIGKLKALNLYNNKLKTIPTNAFKSLRNLDELYLNNNRLKSVDGLFSDRRLSRLKTLNLQHNRIDYLNVSTFDHLQNLITLHLAHNDIVELPDNVFRSLRSLEYLFLNNNKLRRLGQKVFVGLTRLFYLNLDDMQYRIEAIHEDTFNSVPNLSLLYIRNSSLTTLPKLRNHQFLLELHLSNGSIGSLRPSSWLNNTGRLQILRLDHNRVEVLDDFAFRNLTSLIELDLANNGLRSVTMDSFQDLERLVTLNMAHNNLSFAEHVYVEDGFKIMDVFYPLGGLLNLNLSHNLLTQFRYRWFPGTVLHLNLSHNSIRKVSVHGVAGIDMKTIDLSDNEITNIKGVYSFPETIERILLDRNQITRINKNVFETNVNLRQVSLSNNRLRTLELRAPEFSPELGIVKLRLGQNPWLCDCHLKWLKQVIEGENHESRQSYYVQDPGAIACELLYHRERDNATSLSVAVSSEDFMCTFSKKDSNVCMEWLHMSADRFTVCQHDCPEQCTCYRGAEWEIINVDCTGKNLTHVPTNLHRATSALFLDHNRIGVIEAGDFDVKFILLDEVYLNDNVLERIEDGAFEGLATLERLFLQSNRLRRLPTDLFANTTNLVELDLSDNLLTNLSERLFQPLGLLQTLLLNNNQLYTFPVWNFEKQLVRLEVVALYDNPWSCDCDYVASWTNWMRDNAQKLKNADQMYCLSTAVNGTRMSFIAFNMSVCFSAIVHSNRGEIAILTMALCVLVSIVLVSTFVFVYRREMQVLIYSHYGVRLFHESGLDPQDDGDRNKLFDAFVSYSSLDEDFVIRELLPGLEDIERPFKLCLHHRDFPIGVFINESIFESIDKSRRTIVVLSENFMNSDWCRFEFRTAHSQMLHDRRKRVIVIILGDLPKILDPDIRLYLRTKTYLLWNDRFFWEKLYFAMPDKSTALVEDEHTI